MTNHLSSGPRRRSGERAAVNEGTDLNSASQANQTNSRGTAAEQRRRYQALLALRTQNQVDDSLHDSLNSFLSAGTMPDPEAYGSRNLSDILQSALDASFEFDTDSEELMGIEYHVDGAGERRDVAGGGQQNHNAQSSNQHRRPPPPPPPQ